MTSQSVDVKRVVMVRMYSGEDILASLEQAVEDEGIRSGIILNGLGSVQSFRYHVVANGNLPPLEAVPAGRIIPNSL